MTGSRRTGACDWTGEESVEWTGRGSLGRPGGAAAGATPTASSTAPHTHVAPCCHAGCGEFSYGWGQRSTPCRIDSGWRTIRIFTGIRDYFDVRAPQEQLRQHIYDTSSLGKLQDAYFNAHAHVQRTSEAPNGHHATRAAQARHALQTARSRSTPALLHWFSRPLRPRPTPQRAVASHTAYATPRMCRHLDARAADHGHRRHRPPSGPHQRPYSMLLYLPAAPLALFGENIACEHVVLGLHGRQVIAAGLVVQAWPRG